MEQNYTFDENILSDLHKDAYGFRPAPDYYSNWKNLSNNEKQAEWNYLLEKFEQSIEEDRFNQQLAIAKFEERIGEVLKLGAIDRSQAIGWIVDSLNLSEVDKMYGQNFVKYELGLPYSFKLE